MLISLDPIFQGNSRSFVRESVRDIRYNKDVIISAVAAAPALVPASPAALVTPSRILQLPALKKTSTALAASLNPAKTRRVPGEPANTAYHP